MSEAISETRVTDDHGRVLIVTRSAYGTFIRTRGGQNVEIDPEGLVSLMRGLGVSEVVISALV